MCAQNVEIGFQWVNCLQRWVLFATMIRFDLFEKTKSTYIELAAQLAGCIYCGLSVADNRVIRSSYS